MKCAGSQKKKVYFMILIFNLIQTKFVIRDINFLFVQTNIGFMIVVIIPTTRMVTLTFFALSYYPE